MPLRRVRIIDDGIRSDFIARQEEHASRVAGYDSYEIDPTACSATWHRGAEPLWEGRAELISRFFPELGLFRWWWSGQPEHAQLAANRMDEAFAEAQRSDLKALSTRQLTLEDEGDAEMLSRVAAHLAHARAMIRRDENDQVAYYALFDAKPVRGVIRFAADPIRTLPPSAVVSPSRSLPPPPLDTRASQPPTSLSVRPLREPYREFLEPVAQVAERLLRRACPFGFRQALVSVSIDTTRDKARFFVQLVVLDSRGDLEAIDGSKELLDAVGTFISEDVRSGNARWRKFTMRLLPESDSGVAIRAPEVFS